MELFTDWTRTEPTYFFLRGAIWGFVLAFFVLRYVLPKIKHWRNK